MIGCGFAALAVLCVLFVLRIQRPKLWSAVQTTMISAPAEVIFDIICAVERMPQWYGHPSWLPWLFRIANLSLWNEHLEKNLLLEPDAHKRGQIEVRGSRPREYCYLQNSPGRVVFESVFRITPIDHGCLLTWKIDYELPRLADRIAHGLLARAYVRASVDDSLRTIRSMSEHVALRPAWQKFHTAVQKVAANWRQSQKKAS